MDVGHAVFVSSRLILGALAAFLAIMLWSKIRDVAWMFMVIGIVVSYIEIVYSILVFYGFSGLSNLLIGSVPVIEIVLPALRMIFFIAAFFVMVVKQYRR